MQNYFWANIGSMENDIGTHNPFMCVNRRTQLYHEMDESIPYGTVYFDTGTHVNIGAKPKYILKAKSIPI